MQNVTLTNGKWDRKGDGKEETEKTVLGCVPFSVCLLFYEVPIFMKIIIDKELKLVV